MGAVLKRWRKRALEALVIVAVIVGAQYWQTRGLPAGPAPALAGMLTDGRKVSLDDTLKATAGRPVLVAFWATWCPVCKAEDGNLEAKYRWEQGFTLQAYMNPDSAETRRAFVEKREAKF